MILVGQYDSPFVRRVAVSLLHLGMAFERNGLSVFSDAEAMRRINPLGRVPSLVLDNGEILVDSAAILDHLDETAGPAKALLPASGAERRHALQIVALAAGLTEKAVAIGYEHILRPAELRHQPFIDRNKVQLDAAIVALEALTPDQGWFGGGRLLQPDITTACALGYLRLHAPRFGSLPDHPRLLRLCAQAEALAEFRNALPAVAEIGGSEAAAALARLANPA